MSTAATIALAADRTDVPLKNWGAFALYRDAVYDDLERLVTAGMADRVLLSTKPLSRVEAARMVARAIEKVRRDHNGTYNGRGDIEPVLDRLMAEFAVELASLGVKVQGVTPAAPGAFTFFPVDRAQVWTAVTNRDLFLRNGQGRRLEGGLNGGATFETRAQIGDFLSLYVQPETLVNEEAGALRLATGYAKLTLFSIELVVGRESLWWGPALHGSLILSNNAPPLDQIRIGAAESFLLPFVGDWVGPTKVLFFLAQLEERRDHPRAKLSGMRATAAPFSFLEVGISRVIMFGGEDSPRLNLTDDPRASFSPAAGDERVRDAKLRNSNVFAIDADLRLHDVDRYFVPAKDLRLYGEFGWADTRNSNVIPLKEAISALIGVHVLGVFGHEGLDARFEYARTPGLSFTHDRFRSGDWTRGAVISHFIGTGGEEYYARTTNYLTPNVLLGLELNRATAGSTVAGFDGPKERRIAGGIDLSYRFGAYSLFAQYQLAHVGNRNFKAGNNGFDHLLRLELTRSFR